MGLRSWLNIVLLAGCGVTCRAEITCFRTVQQAAVQIGEEEGAGYRLLFIWRDSIAGKNWAGVGRCGHPEWPAVLVPSKAAEVHPDSFRVGHAGLADVVAGRRVRVTDADAMVRIEMAGVAQQSGFVGDRVRVRVPGPDAGGPGRELMAMVRSAELLEVVR